MNKGNYYKDGHYTIEQILDAVNKDFSSEKELCSFIENNIEEFCKECLGVKYLSHRKEVPLAGGNGSRRIKGGKRLDFLIKTTTGKLIALECKDPLYNGELHGGVGQVLSYLTVAEIFSFKLDEIYIVSSKIDGLIPLIIDKFNLPISFIVLDKSKFLKFINGSAKRK